MTQHCKTCRKDLEPIVFNENGKDYKTCNTCRNKRKARRKCPHGKRKSQCKDCGGASICEHGRRKSRCKDCVGASICEHGRRKSTCKDCATLLKCPDCGLETVKATLVRHMKTCTGDEIGSAGEVSIKRVLDSMRINYDYDSTFTDLMKESGQNLRFDFIIHSDKTLMVEYDGRQHFRPVTFGGMSKEQAELNFEKQKKHDQIKNDFCEKYNYLLLRIPYTDFGKIPLLITDFICKNTDWGVE